MMTFDVNLLFIINSFVHDFTLFGKFEMPAAVLMMTLYLDDLGAALIKHFTYIATAFVLSKRLLKLVSVHLLNLGIYYYFVGNLHYLLIIGHN